MPGGRGRSQSRVTAPPGSRRLARSSEERGDAGTLTKWEGADSGGEGGEGAPPVGEGRRRWGEIRGAVGHGGSLYRQQIK
uniref:Uncharacterized protein n=1 Tax=Oryza sativa subsp. japonica TaxID=39947 RepID=Q6K3X2_ORYSJ|nr:hypothetical protein [Oryza sativa Japonica Group]